MIVLTFVHAPWCHSCGPVERTLATLCANPIYHSVHRQDADIDTPAGNAIARNLGVQSLPTVLLHQDGREAARFTGSVPPRTVERALQALLQTQQ